MADPLSITAGIVAVVGAAGGITKTLGKIKDLRNAPDELLALINEVSDLRLILNDLQHYILQNTQRQQILQEELQHLSILVGRAKDKLLQLDELIQYRLVKPDSIFGEIKVSKREWARARSSIVRFQQSLRDIRLNIATHMVVINSYVRICDDVREKPANHAIAPINLALVLRSIKFTLSLASYNQTTIFLAVILPSSLMSIPGSLPASQVVSPLYKIYSSFSLHPPHKLIIQPMLATAL